MRKFIVFLCVFSFFSPKIFSKNDKEIFISCKSECKEDLMKIAKFFIGTPYKSATLEGNAQEKLVINLRELDCTTFVENMIAIKLSDDFENFKQNLQKIRYRNGEINGYHSRLHYFRDWIFDGEKKQIFKNVTKDFGGEILQKKINFMSENSQKYAALKNNENEKSHILEIENALNLRTHYYIKKENFSACENKIKNGDVIGFCSAVKGLDVSHVGFAVWENGELHLLHASSIEKKVMISQKKLAEYLAGNEKMTGIIILRLENNF